MNKALQAMLKIIDVPAQSRGKAEITKNNTISFGSLLNNMKLNSVSENSISIFTPREISLKDLSILLDQNKIEIFVQEGKSFINIKDIKGTNIDFSQKELFLVPENKTRKFIEESDSTRLTAKIATEESNITTLTTKNLKDEIQHKHEAGYEKNQIKKEQRVLTDTNVNNNVGTVVNNITDGIFPHPEVTNRMLKTESKDQKNSNNTHKQDSTAEVSTTDFATPENADAVQTEIQYPSATNNSLNNNGTSKIPVNPLTNLNKSSFSNVSTNFMSRGVFVTRSDDNGDYPEETVIESGKVKAGVNEPQSIRTGANDTKFVRTGNFENGQTSQENENNTTDVKATQLSGNNGINAIQRSNSDAILQHNRNYQDNHSSFTKSENSFSVSYRDNQSHAGKEINSLPVNSQNFSSSKNSAVFSKGIELDENFTMLHPQEVVFNKLNVHEKKSIFNENSKQVFPEEINTTQNNQVAGKTINENLASPSLNNSRLFPDKKDNIIFQNSNLDKDQTVATTIAGNELSNGKTNQKEAIEANQPQNITLKRTSLLMQNDGKDNSQSGQTTESTNHESKTTANQDTFKRNTQYDSDSKIAKNYNINQEHSQKSAGNTELLKAEIHHVNPIMQHSLNQGKGAESAHVSGIMLKSESLKIVTGESTTGSNQNFKAETASGLTESKNNSVTIDIQAEKSNQVKQNIPFTFPSNKANIEGGNLKHNPDNIDTITVTDNKLSNPVANNATIISLSGSEATITESDIKLKNRTIDKSPGSEVKVINSNLRLSSREIDKSMGSEFEAINSNVRLNSKAIDKSMGSEVKVINSNVRLDSREIDKSMGSEIEAINSSVRLNSKAIDKSMGSEVKVINSGLRLSSRAIDKSMGSESEVIDSKANLNNKTTEIVLGVKAETINSDIKTKGKPYDVTSGSEMRTTNSIQEEAVINDNQTVGRNAKQSIIIPSGDKETIIERSVSISTNAKVADKSNVSQVKEPDKTVSLNPITYATNQKLSGKNELPQQKVVNDINPELKTKNYDNFLKDTERYKTATNSEETADFQKQEAVSIPDSAQKSTNSVVSNTGINQKQFREAVTSAIGDKQHANAEGIKWNIKRPVQIIYSKISEKSSAQQNSNAEVSMSQDLNNIVSNDKKNTIKITESANQIFNNLNKQDISSLSDTDKIGMENNFKSTNKGIFTNSMVVDKIQTGNDSLANIDNQAKVTSYVQNQGKVTSYVQNQAKVTGLPGQESPKQIPDAVTTQHNHAVLSNEKVLSNKQSLTEKNPQIQDSNNMSKPLQPSVIGVNTQEQYGFKSIDSNSELTKLTANLRKQGNNTDVQENPQQNITVVNSPEQRNSINVTLKQMQDKTATTSLKDTSAAHANPDSIKYSLRADNLSSRSTTLNQERATSDRAINAQSASVGNSALLQSTKTIRENVSDKPREIPATNLFGVKESASESKRDTTISTKLTNINNEKAQVISDVKKITIPDYQHQDKQLGKTINDSLNLSQRIVVSEKTNPPRNYTLEKGKQQETYILKPLNSNSGQNTAVSSSSVTSASQRNNFSTKQENAMPTELLTSLRNSTNTIISTVESPQTKVAATFQERETNSGTNNNPFISEGSKSTGFETVKQSEAQAESKTKETGNIINDFTKNRQNSFQETNTALRNEKVTANAQYNSVDTTNSKREISEQNNNRSTASEKNQFVKSAQYDNLTRPDIMRKNITESGEKFSYQAETTEKQNTDISQDMTNLVEKLQKDTMNAAFYRAEPIKKEETVINIDGKVISQLKQTGKISDNSVVIEKSNANGQSADKLAEPDNLSKKQIFTKDNSSQTKQTTEQLFQKITTPVYTRHEAADNNLSNSFETPKKIDSAEDRLKQENGDKTNLSAGTMATKHESAQKDNPEVIKRSEVYNNDQAQVQNTGSSSSGKSTVRLNEEKSHFNFPETGEKYLFAGENKNVQQHKEMNQMPNNSANTAKNSPNQATANISATYGNNEQQMNTSQIVSRNEISGEEQQIYKSSGSFGTSHRDENIQENHKNITNDESLNARQQQNRKSTAGQENDSLSSGAVNQQKKSDEPTFPGELRSANQSNLNYAQENLRNTVSGQNQTNSQSYKQNPENISNNEIRENSTHDDHSEEQKDAYQEKKDNQGNPLKEKETVFTSELKEKNTFINQSKEQSGQRNAFPDSLATTNFTTNNPDRLVSLPQTQQSSRQDLQSEIRYMHQEIIKELREKIDFELKDEMKWAKVSMKMENLGKIDATVRREGNNLNVVINSESIGKMRFLQENLPDLKQDLSRYGFDNINLDFTFGDGQENNRAFQNQSQEDVIDSRRTTNVKNEQKIERNDSIPRKYGYSTIEYVV